MNNVGKEKFAFAILTILFLSCDKQEEKPQPKPEPEPRQISQYIVEDWDWGDSSKSTQSFTLDTTWDGDTTIYF